VKALDLIDVIAARPPDDDINTTVSAGTVDALGTVHGPHE
jgi:hypothetical protein